MEETRAVADKFSILYRGDDATVLNFKPALDPSTKISRYWPGKAPKWAEEEKEEEEIIVLRDKVAENRLRRLAAAAQDRGETTRITRERRVEEAAVILPKKAAVPVPDPKLELKLDSEDEQELRRARLREAAALRRMEEEAAQEASSDDDEKEEEQGETDSEYDSDSEEEELGRPMVKPVYVPKGQRQTIKEREAQEALAMLREQERLDLAEARKAETQELLAAEIKAEAELAQRAAETANSDTEMPDDDDDVNEYEEYECWKIRELKRLKRDDDDKQRLLKEAAEVLRRRNMTDAERKVDDARMDALKPEVARGDMQFMQKYYHRGAFFQDTVDDEEILRRDYNQAVVSENVDVSTLPKAMQLRRGQWGKKGQVKHTHLADVDTTDVTAAWSQKGDQVWDKYMSKRAGVKASNEFERPTKKPKY